jgi:hypothetical protein
VDDEFTLGKPVDHVRVKLTFGFKHPGRERLRSIVIENRDSALGDDGSVIVMIIEKMNRATRDLAAVVQNRLMDFDSVISRTAKRRNQTWMDIDDAIGIVVRNG